MAIFSFIDLARQKNKIVIPIIQRDYAQGRADAHTTQIRRDFVRDLKSAVLRDGEPLVLDFIFGRNENGVFIPLDGQQRLTTLFLLHLYALARAGNPGDAGSALCERFQYEVREDTRAFGQKLASLLFEGGCADALPLASGAPGNDLEDFIVAQPWFSPRWRRDPTITGMLVMLDEIRRQFHDVPDLWQKLTDEGRPPIQFYFEDVARLDASAEDMFIKMNARGRQLTPFENFKARFIEWLKKNAADQEAAFARKMDGDWLQIFWNNFGRDYTAGDKAEYTDRCFYNFLQWLAQMLRALPLRGEEPGEELEPDVSGDLYGLFASALAKGREQLLPEGNLAFLQKTLDSLSRLDKSGIRQFFDDIFNNGDESPFPPEARISMFREIQLFDAVCQNRAGMAQGQMLLACLLLLNGGKNAADITGNPVDLGNLRTLRNLLENSEYELRQDNLPCHIRAIARLVLNNELGSASRYNGFQIQEEIAKRGLRETLDKSDAANMDWLENHPLLRGRLLCLRSLPAEGKKGDRAELAFDRDGMDEGRNLFSHAIGQDAIGWQTMLRGFLSQGRFALPVSYNWLYLGVEAAPQRRYIFGDTGEESSRAINQAVRGLAAKTAGCRDRQQMERDIEGIASAWLDERQNAGELDWRWYFVKYPEMLPDPCESQGYYGWYGSQQSFLQWAMAKKYISGEHWNPFLWAVYVRAGFGENTPGVHWTNCMGRDSHEPICFACKYEGKKCELGLWPGEVYWMIYTCSGNRPGAIQRAAMKYFAKNMCEKELEVRFVDGEDACYFFIAGEDSQVIDYENFTEDDVWHIHRLHDYEDRIELGVALARELAAMT